MIELPGRRRSKGVNEVTTDFRDIETWSSVDMAVIKDYGIYRLIRRERTWARNISPLWMTIGRKKERVEKCALRSCSTAYARRNLNMIKVELEKTLRFSIWGCVCVRNLVQP